MTARAAGERIEVRLEGEQKLPVEDGLPAREASAALIHMPISTA